MTNFSLSRWEEKSERERRNKKNLKLPLKTSLESGPEPHIHTRQLGNPEDTLGATGEHLGCTPTCPRPPPVPWVLGVSPEVARTQQDRPWLINLCELWR